MNGRRERYVDLRKNAPRQAAAALHYDPASGEAPEVLATGHGIIAANIVKLAVEHGVPLHQDAALVEALARLDIGDLIPRELYAVVAEVLAFVSRLDTEVGAARAQAACGAPEAG